MIHGADVERSAEFYRLLGFAVGNSVPVESPMEWAWLYASEASDWKRGPNLMVSRSARAVDPSAQDVLFYLYATDLPSLRSTLLSQGVRAGEHRAIHGAPRRVVAAHAGHLGQAEVQ
jgi:hypothetical protein